MPNTVTRRSLFSGATAAWLAWAMAGNSTASAWESPSFPANPFTLGIASGEPLPTGVVLWTKLAPQPLAEDGKAGMPDKVVAVRWEVAADVDFTNIVTSGAARATPEMGHSVHVEVDGLRPSHQYYYRFTVGEHVSTVGRTRTAPPEDALDESLTFALACCQNYASGYFTAHDDVAARNVDLVVFVGDYIYEGPGQGSVGRGHLPAREIFSLADYRVRYAQYKTDPGLQAAHASAPWVAVFDDHELDNNWADDVPPANQTREEFLLRRAAAFQAYYENLPLRPFSQPEGIDIQLYRRVRWGQLATFHVLDYRQYRDPYPCGGVSFSDCEEARDPARTVLGFRQEKWLLNGFDVAQARWDFIAQQGAFVKRLIDRDGVLLYKMDAWDGYVGSQRRVTQGWIDAGVRNPVVLSGDIHANWATDLKLDYDSPNADLVGSEFIATSITTGGNGEDLNPPVSRIFEFNDHLRFHNNQRGYILFRVTPDGLEADYQCVMSVEEPNARVFTRATMRIDDGVRGLEQIYDNPSVPPTTRTLSEEQKLKEIDELMEWESDDEEASL